MKPGIVRGSEPGLKKVVTFRANKLMNSGKSSSSVNRLKKAETLSNNSQLKNSKSTVGQKGPQIFEGMPQLLISAESNDLKTIRSSGLRGTESTD